MKKTRRNRFGAQPRDRSTTRRLPLVGILVDLREGLRGMAVKAGLEVLREMLEQDRTALVGPHYGRIEERRAYRAGTAPGEVVMGGRKVKVRRPRARSLEGRELPLPTYEEFGRLDPLSDQVLAQMFAGVSTRHYGEVLEPVGEDVETGGTSKSVVSRHFVRRTQAEVCRV